MSAPIILPCAAVRVGGNTSNPKSLVASFQVQGAMAAMTLTGVGFPQVQVRLERDSSACKMSHPDKKGRYVVMVLHVNLVRPLKPQVAQFWGKTKGRVLFPKLFLLFDQESSVWSQQTYEAFVQSVKPNFPGDTWEYLGPEESDAAWVSGGTISGVGSTHVLLGPVQLKDIELDQLEAGQWIGGDIVNFALQETYKELEARASGIWLANTYFLPVLRRKDSTRDVIAWLPESAHKCRYWIIPGFSEELKHWFTIIVANPGHCFLADQPDGNWGCTIVILDSFFRDRVHSKDTKAIQDLFRELGHQQGLKYTKDPKVIQPRVPKQNNGDDCGIYAIHFARLWLREGDRLMDVVLNPSMSQQDIERAWKCWRIGGLWTRLREEILTVAEKSWFEQEKQRIV